MRFSIEDPESIVDPSQSWVTCDLSSSSKTRVRSTGVHQGFLLVSKYEVGYLKHFRHIPMLYPFEWGINVWMCRGIALSFYLALEHLITDGFFSQVVDYIRAI